MTWKTASAIGWTLLIVALCTIPGPDLPGPNVVGTDKIAHFTLFAVFAWLWLSVMGDRPASGILYVVLGGLLLAGLTEVYQGFLPFDRQPSVADALANTAGLAAGIAVHRLRSRRQK